MFRNLYDGVWGLAPSAEGGRASDIHGVSGVQGRSPWKIVVFLTSLLIEIALEYEHLRFEFSMYQDNIYQLLSKLCKIPE